MSQVLTVHDDPNPNPNPNPSPNPNQVLTVRDDPAAFAEAAARLLLDGAAWSAHSDASLRHTRTVLRARLSVGGLLAGPVAATPPRAQG